MSWGNQLSPQWRLVNAGSRDQHKELKLERASHTATVVKSSIYVVAGRKGSTFCADLLRFDTSSHTWSVVFPSIPNGFRARANHTATLIGGRQLWVVAGSDNEDVIADVHVLDIPTLTWSKPHLSGDTFLLMRTAHSAELHPTDPRAILLFGGYGGTATSTFHNDLTIIRTHSMRVDRFALREGVPPPVPRGYHSCTAVGTRCYVYGGRTECGVVADEDMLAVFDAAEGCWVAPGPVEGSKPPARSSHRAVALGNRVLIHGGAAKGEQSDRLSDVHSLLPCPATGRLTWSRVDEPRKESRVGAAAVKPPGRAAHTVSLVGSDRLYVISGYVGSHLGPHRYSAEVYCLQLANPVSEPLVPGSRSKATESEPPLPSPLRPAAPRGHLLATPPQPKTGSRSQRSPHTPSRGAAADMSSGMSPGNGIATQAAAPATSPLAAHPQQQVCTPSRSLQGSGGKAVRAPAPADGGDGTAAGNAARIGVGAEDDPIDLTADLPGHTAHVGAWAAVPLRGHLTNGTAAAAAAAPATTRNPHPLHRVRGASGGAGCGIEQTGAGLADGIWLGGGGRRGRGVGGSGGGVARPPDGPGARAGTGAAGSGLASETRSLAAAIAKSNDALTGRPAKRPATDAAVTAAAVPRGRPPIHAPAAACVQQAPSGTGLSARTAAAADAIDLLEMPPLHVPHYGQGGQGGVAWQAQGDVYGPGGPAAATIAAAATAAATAAMAAAGGSGGGQGAAFQRAPSPTHAGEAAQSHEALLVVFQRLQDDNQHLRRQLQIVEDELRRTTQQLAAQQEKQRLTDEDLSTQRRSCGVAQAALRAANKDLDESRSLLETTRQDLVATRQQAAAMQQQLVAAQQEVMTAGAREQAAGREHAAVQAHLAEELHKSREQNKSLEAAVARQQSELNAARAEQREEARRQHEAASALAERLRSREVEVVDLTTHLQAAASRHQEQQEVLRRILDAKQQLERDVSEAREGQQRLQRQLDEQISDFARQREAMRTEIAQDNIRISALEAELRSTSDDIAHREAQHAVLVKSYADRVAELAAARDIAAREASRVETLRQHAAVIHTHLANLETTMQQAASVAQAMTGVPSGT